MDSADKKKIGVPLYVRVLSGIIAISMEPDWPMPTGQ
jgi:hypothetical protein